MRPQPHPKSHALTPRTHPSPPTCPVRSRLALCGESFYNDKIPSMLAWLAEANDVAGVPLLEKDDGATVLRVPGHEVPLMVQKTDGGFGYDTTDL